jgi:hypothetical protein
MISLVFNKNITHIVDLLKRVTKVQRPANGLPPRLRKKRGMDRK